MTMVDTWFRRRDKTDKPQSDSLTFATSSTPGRYQLIVAGLLTLFLFIVGLACTPIADQPLVAVPGFMTAFGSGMVVINLLVATLLLSKGSIERRPDAVRLGVAYLYVGLIFIPLLLSFKDGFVPCTLIGKPGSSVWLWSFWHAGFALAMLWYALSVGRASRVPPVGLLCAAVVAVVCGLAGLSTLGIDELPAVLVNGKTFFSGALTGLPTGLLLLNGAALLMCLCLRARTSEQLWVTVAMAAACFDLWLTVHGTTRFALGWYLSKCGSFTTSLVVVISQFHDINILYRRSADANRALERLAHRDGLTGVYNRRRFDDLLAVEWQKAGSDRAALSLLMLDVDFFKQFNDQYGHLAGDECLRAVALRLSETAHRPTDIVTRYGGEEFAILLPATNAMDARILADRLRSEIADLLIPHHHSPTGHLTVSVGVATLQPDAKTGSPTLVRLADDALYLAKSRGRNQVAACSDIVDPMQAARQAKDRIKLVLVSGPAA